MSALVIICLYACLFLTSHGFPMPPRPQTQEKLLAIELDDMIKGRFSPKGFNGSWVSGHHNNKLINTVNSIDLYNNFE